MTHNNKGKFYIDRELIDRDPSMVAFIMSSLRVVVLRAESLLHNDVVEYYALSPCFDPVSPGLVAPEYDILVTRGLNSGEIAKVEAKAVLPNRKVDHDI